MRLHIEQKRQMIWAFIIIPMIFNYFFWIDGSSPSYVMSFEFQKTFWLLSPLVSLFAMTQIDSGVYIPSLRRLGLPWHLSYTIEKILHGLLCFVSISSFLLLLTALLIRHAPNHYMETGVGQLTEERFIVYHYYWQLNTLQLHLAGRDFKISKSEYNWLQDHRQDPIRVRVKHNLAGSSVTIIRN